MAETTLTITHHHGLHARPAALFYRKAREYRCAVTVQNLNHPERGEVPVSPFYLLQIGVREGDAIRVRAVGDDADAAISALVTLVSKNFGD